MSKSSETTFPPKTQIVPRKESNSFDFCGANDTLLIRSDLKCFMRCYNLNKASSARIHPLHQACLDGDHYFACYHSRFCTRYYIIKDDKYHYVTDLQTGEGQSEELLLHDKCKGGDFYLGSTTFHAFSSEPVFFIIFAQRGKFRVVSDLSTDKESARACWRGKEFDLASDCKDGLYYWCTKSQVMGEELFYIVKQVQNWGAQFYVTTDMKSNSGHELGFHQSVTNFIPGGLAVTNGPTLGKWECIFSYQNRGTEAETRQSIKIKKKKGYTKSFVTQMIREWGITGTLGAAGGLSVVGIEALKTQISLSGSYGGKRINTTQQDWTAEEEFEDDIDFGIVSPGQKKSIWQYVVTMEKGGDILKFNEYEERDEPAQRKDQETEKFEKIDGIEESEEAEIREMKYCIEPTIDSHGEKAASLGFPDVPKRLQF